MRTLRLECILIGSACAAIAGLAIADPTVVGTEVLGPFTGHDAKLHPDNLAPNRIAYYGTDLGFSYVHQGELHFLFGDTAAVEALVPIQASTSGRYDDSFGTVDLGAYRDPRRFSPGHIPLIKLGQNPGTAEMSAINPGIVMDSGKTPMAGFSNGRREFAIFNTTKPLACRVDADCGADLACDTGLGFVGTRYTQQEGLTIPCRDGDPGCNADTMTDAAGSAAAGTGFCADRTSTIWADTDAGRIASVALEVRIGMRSLTDPREYGEPQRWLTNKFANVIARTVSDFRPEKGAGYRHQDYRPATRAGGNQRLLLWGRPGFIGVAASKRTLGLYFGYVDLPKGPGYSWEVHYYRGSAADGTPRFSANQRDAEALDLDSKAAGIEAAEVFDVVNQMSVAWIPPLRKWVMFYGGGMTKLPLPPLPRCGVLELFTGRDCANVVIGNGAVHMRTADDPWGPWSAPQDVVVGGDPAVAGSGLYGVGGPLHHPACTAPGCATPTRTAFYHPDEYGFLYGSNIIEQWTTRSRDGVDLIWNASTWDPYRVILLRTRIRP
jgi:hypothetical protein